MNTADLIKAAVDAKPSAATKSRWGHLFPVIDQLRNNGFSSWEATRWLVEQNALPQEKRRTLYHSFLGYDRRRQGKK